MSLSHLDNSGKLDMVDVSAKPALRRTAVAQGFIRITPQTVELIKSGALKKGDALACARVAGIAAAKQTPHLIPLCHTIPVDRITVDFEFRPGGIAITASTVCIAKTGIEMEALTAVSVAALTLYDMCKASDKNMVIDGVKLVEKRKEPVP